MLRYWPTKLIFVFCPLIPNKIECINKQLSVDVSGPNIKQFESHR